MDKRGSFRRWSLVFLFMLIIIAVGNGIQPSADETSITSNPFDSIQLNSRFAYAGACPANGTVFGRMTVCNNDGRQSSVSKQELIKDFVVDNLLEPKAWLCLYAKVPDGCDVDQENGTMSVTASIEPGTFPMVYIDESAGVAVWADEQVDITGSVSATYSFDKKKLSGQDYKIKLDTINGGINGVIYHRISGKTDRTYNMKDAYPDIVLDENLSKNVMEFEGVFNYSVDAKFENGVETSSSSFCPNKCTVWNKNELSLSGDIKENNSFSDIKGGRATIKTTHEETYSGTGDMSSQIKDVWSDDLEVVKNDYRLWNINVDVGRSLNANVIGSSNSSANIKPFQNKEVVKTESSDTFYFPAPWSAGGPSGEEGGDFQGMMGIEYSESNIDGTVHRTGSGFVNINGEEQIRGIFDDIDANMLVTAVGGIPSTSFRTSLYEQSGVREYYNKVSQIFQPLVMENSVPGYFSTSEGDAGATVIKTPEYKVLPKNIIITYSFSNSRKNEIHKQIYDEYVPELVDKLESWGVSVSTVDTTSKNAMFAAWSAAPEGAMIINFGHGGAGVLYAGDEGVSYRELRQIIDARSIKLSTIAFHSCFSASAQGELSSVAEQIVGSASFGFSIDNNSGNYGNLFGVGANNYNNTAADLIGGIFGSLNSIALAESESCKVDYPDEPAPDNGQVDEMASQSTDLQINEQTTNLADNQTEDQADGQAESRVVDQNGPATTEPIMYDSGEIFNTSDFPVQLELSSVPTEDYNWFSSPDQYFNDPAQYDPFYSETTDIVESGSDMNIWSMPMVESLPYYAPEHEMGMWESWVDDTFNFEPEPVVYNDPYYEESFYYQPEPEPLFNDWYDYVTPMDYMDYSYNIMEEAVNNVVDYFYSWFEPGM